VALSGRPFSCSTGDHLGTTRYKCDRTTRRSPPIVPCRLRASEQRRRLLPRSGGQGVAGSNPAVPTGTEVVSNIVTPHTSQQKSLLGVQWPFPRPAPRPRHGAPSGHVPRQQSRQSRPVKGPRSLNHLRSAPRPRTTANRSAPSPAHPLTAGPTLTGVPQLQDAGKPGCSNQACSRRLGRDGRWRETCLRTGRHDGSDLHRHLETRLDPRHGEVPSRSAANAMYRQMSSRL